MNRYTMGTDDANIQDPSMVSNPHLRDPTYRHTRPNIPFTYIVRFDSNNVNEVELEICCHQDNFNDVITNYGNDVIRNRVATWLVETMNFLEKAGLQPFGNHRPNRYTRPIVLTSMQDFMMKIEWNTPNQYMIKHDPNNRNHAPASQVWGFRLDTNLEFTQFSHNGTQIYVENLVNPFFNRLVLTP